MTVAASAASDGAPAAPAAPEDGEAAGLRREAARIEHLLDDVRSLAGRPVWDRVEELVQRLMRLYGAALARMMGHLAATEAAEDPQARPLATRLAEDELIASLLLLHGLHPLPVLDRVRRALELARPHLEEQLGPFTLLGVEADVVHLRLDATGSVGAGPVISAERLLATALQDAAPEITRVDIQGLRRPAAASRDPALVQIDLSRVRKEPRP